MRPEQSGTPSCILSGDGHPERDHSRMKQIPDDRSGCLLPALVAPVGFPIGRVIVKVESPPISPPIATLPQVEFPLRTLAVSSKIRLRLRTSDHTDVASGGRHPKTSHETTQSYRD